MEKCKKWLAFANKYMGKCSWQDLALVKICMFSFGIFVGIVAFHKTRKQAGLIAFLTYVGTLIPILIKFVPSAMEEFKGTDDFEE